ncbi:MAG: hypothetical protein NZ578_14365 [Candidatus Binatia bacterium]|nr:hypothetical protein [Candidatus Binatia bacterium]
MPSLRTATATAAEQPSSLVTIVAEELEQPVPPEVLSVAATIQRRHGEAVAAILFYGSCLRTRTVTEGVLDFYVLVDTYRAVYSSWLLRVMNAVLPPNVFYLEVRAGEHLLRAKYAVISTRDFTRAATPRGLHAIVWGRFCQPTRLAYVRDQQARALVVHTLVTSILTMVTHMVALVSSPKGMVRVHPADLWQRGFCETYGSEWRAEKPETIRKLYEAAAERYDRVAREALSALERQGIVRVRPDGATLELAVSTPHRRRLVYGWCLRRPLAKGLYAIRLLKSAVTFRDWLPYVLWKLERHSGRRVVASARQRRHPFLLGGLLVLKLLLQRAFR